MKFASVIPNGCYGHVWIRLNKVSPELESVSTRCPSKRICERTRSVVSKLIWVGKVLSRGQETVKPFNRVIVSRLQF